MPYPSDPQSFNRYAYARDNPIRYVDPSGHCFICVAIGVGILLGGIAGGISAAVNGGNIGKGILMGAAIGAASGFMAGHAMAAGMAALGISSVGEATILQGALIGTVGGTIGGFGSGMASGYAGGRGDFGDMLTGGAWGALSGGITGGIAGGLSSTQFTNGILGKGWMTDAQLQARNVRVNKLVALLKSGQLEDSSGAFKDKLPISYLNTEKAAVTSTAASRGVIGTGNNSSVASEFYSDAECEVRPYRIVETRVLEHWRLWSSIDGNIQLHYTYYPNTVINMMVPKHYVLQRPPVIIPWREVEYVDRWIISFSYQRKEKIFLYGPPSK